MPKIPRNILRQNFIVEITFSNGSNVSQNPKHHHFHKLVGTTWGASPEAMRFGLVAQQTCSSD